LKKHLGKTLLLIAVCFALGGAVRTLAAKVDAGKVAKIQAGCIYHLAKLVTWPQDRFENKDAPIVVGFLGEDDSGVADYFESQAPSFTAQDRKLVVKKFHDFVPVRAGIITRSKFASELRQCHILYISPSEEARMDDIQEILKDSGVLTVGGTESFTNSGGMVGFTVEKDSLKIRVYLKRVESQNLKISAQFLQHVVIVESDDKK
jgi:hypothetical protein